MVILTNEIILGLQLSNDRGGWIVDNYPELDHDQKEFLKNKTFYGWEIVQSTRRLCLMNRQEKQYDHHQRRRHPEKRRSDL